MIDLFFFCQYLFPPSLIFKSNFRSFIYYFFKPLSDPLRVQVANPFLSHCVTKEISSHPTFCLQKEQTRSAQRQWIYKTDFVLLPTCHGKFNVLKGKEARVDFDNLKSWQIFESWNLIIITLYLSSSKWVESSAIQLCHRMIQSSIHCS